MGPTLVSACKGVNELDDGDWRHNFYGCAPRNSPDASQFHDWECQEEIVDRSSQSRGRG